MLKVYPTCGMEVLMTMCKHAPIVVERETYFEYGRVFQEVDDTLRKPHKIEAEEEAYSVASNLEKRNFILHTSLERRAGFGVDTQELEGAQILDSTPRFAFALYHNDAASEGVTGQGGDERLVGLGE